MAPSPRPNNGGAFVALLVELGYDGGELSAEMFDWLFGLPSVRVQAFLEWFLSSIKPRQSVVKQLQSANDYAIYSALLNDDGEERGQRGLLYGRELEAQERACQVDSQHRHVGEDSLDALLARNGTLEQEILHLEAQLQRLNTKNDKIAKLVQKATLRADAHAQSQQRMAGKEHFNELLAEMQAPCVAHRVAASKQHTANALSAQIDSILDYLSTTTLDSNGNPTSSSSNRGQTLPPPSFLGSQHHHRKAQAEWKSFLYQQPLSVLQDTELHNLDAMKAKVASIVAGDLSDSTDHGGGMTAMAGSSHRAARGKHGSAMLLLTADDQSKIQQPSWFHDSDPDKLHLREQDAHIYNKCSLELARLEKAYAVGEQDALLAQMQLARNESLWHQISDSRHFLFQQYQLMSDDALTARRQRLVASMAATKQESARFVHHVLPKAFDEMAFLKSTTILLGSYEQKLWRQENRFLKLRGVLDAFHHQHGRLKLVHRLLDAEWGDLQQVDAILASFFEEIEHESVQIQARLPRYDVGAASSTHHGDNGSLVRASLPDSDEVAHALYNYIQKLVDEKQEGESGDRVVRDGDCSAATQSTGSYARHSSLRLRTFHELVRLCDRKLAHEASVSERLDRVEQEWLALYDSKRAALLALRQELFGDATSSTPMLLPSHLVANFQEMVAAKEHTEQELHAALECLRLKKRELSMDPTKRQQQEEQCARLQHELEQRGRLGVGK